MCGRIFQALPLMRLLQIARTKNCDNPEFHTTSYNVCPTSHVPVIKPNRFYVHEKGEEAVSYQDMEEEEARELCFMKWGQHTKHNTVINGRIEEMLDKRMFLSMIKNRCVVIMEGYFEWNQSKEPFSLRPKEGDHFLVAALYNEANEMVILTKDATPQLSRVHSRMPVILSHQEVSLWMNPRNTKDIQKIIHQSLLKKQKEVWKNVGIAKIAPHVNTLKEKSIRCLMTFEDYKKELDKTGLLKYWKKAPAVQAIGIEGKPAKDSINHLKEPETPEKRQLPSKKESEQRSASREKRNEEVAAQGDAEGNSKKVSNQEMEEARGC